MITTIINKEINIYDRFGKVTSTYPNGILIESTFIIINDFYKIESKIYENASYTTEFGEFIVNKGSNVSNTFPEYLAIQINWNTTPKTFEVINDDIIQTVSTYIKNVIKNYCILQSNNQYSSSDIYQQID
jgi:hypothetical protein